MQSNLKAKPKSLGKDMYDYINSSTDKDLRGILKISPLGQYNIQTGEESTKHPESTYNGLKITHAPTTTYIQNSIHKMWHGVNYTDFHFTDVIMAIRKMCLDLGLNPYEERLHNLEFGVNVVLPENIPARKFLRNCVSYKGSQPAFMRLAHGAICMYSEHQRFKLKGYEKGTQNKAENPLLGNMLRYEIKASKMIYLQSLGIRYYSDLLDPYKASKLVEILKKVFDEIVFRDWSIDKAKLSKPKRKVFENWSNPLYVENLHKTNQARYKYEKPIFAELAHQYSELNIKNTVWNLIEKKWSKLLTMDLKSYTLLTNFLSQYPQYNLYQINHSIIRLIPYNFIRPELVNHILKNTPIKQGLKLCAITGNDIADQRPGSRFISAKKLGESEAHRLRNIDSNPRNKLRYKLEQYSTRNELFPLTETLTLKTEHVEVLEHWRGTRYDILTQLNY